MRERELFFIFFVSIYPLNDGKEEIRPSQNDVFYRLKSWILSNFTMFDIIISELRGILRKMCRIVLFSI